MSEPPEEKCIWCAGDDGELTTVEVPVSSEVPAGEPRLEEVAVHPGHESEARDYCTASAEHAKRDLMITIAMPLLVVAAVPLGQLLSGLGGSGHAWTGGLLGLLFALYGGYLLRFPYAFTPRRLSLKIGGLRRARQIVRAAGGAVALLGPALIVLVTA